MCDQQLRNHQGRLATVTGNQMAVILLFLAVLSPWQTSRAAIVDGFPDALVCSVRDPTGLTPWEELVFYVSARTLNGDALYKTLTANTVVIIVSSDGILNAPNLAQCDGRSVEELFESGRAFYLTPAGAEVRASEADRN
jgi:hypothetical protein